MCDPVTLGLSALQGMSSISAINSQNAAAGANAANARAAMNDEQASTQLSFVEQNRSLIQGGFDAVLEGRSNEAVAYTSAIENGIQGASVKAAIRAQKQKTNRSSARTGQEMKSLRTQTGANLKHTRTKAQGRINSVPTTKFGLGDAAGVLAPIVKSYQD